MNKIFLTTACFLLITSHSFAQVDSTRLKQLEERFKVVQQEVVQIKAQLYDLEKSLVNKLQRLEAIKEEYQDEIKKKNIK